MLISPLSWPVKGSARYGFEVTAHVGSRTLRPHRWLLPDLAARRNYLAPVGTVVQQRFIVIQAVASCTYPSQVLSRRTKPLDLVASSWPARGAVLVSTCAVQMNFGMKVWKYGLTASGKRSSGPRERCRVIGVPGVTTIDPASRKDIPGSLSCFGGALGSLGRSLSRRVDEVTAEQGLTADLWYALDEIIQNDGISMTELARKLSVPAPTVTKFVDRLVGDALAFRLVDQADRRRVLVHASRRADEVYQRVLSDVQRVETSFRADLSNEDRSMLQTLLADAEQVAPG